MGKALLEAGHSLEPMRVLVASERDEASRSQRDALLRLASWSEGEPFEGRATWIQGDLRIVTISDDHLYRDHVDRNVSEHFGDRPTLIVYLSKHRSESERPSLTVHPIGNLGRADFGGRPRTLVPAAPREMTSALRTLRREAHGLGYEVTFEATHHGPLLETPTFYIEQGSTVREWNDPKASLAIARTLLDLDPVDAPAAIGLGGGHYAPRHTDLALERAIAFGHLLPAYALDDLEETVLADAITKTGATLAYLHRKSLPKPAVRSWEERLETLGLRIVREADLPLSSATKGS